MLGPFVPAQIIDIIRGQMLKLAEGNDTGLLSLGLAGAIWSSSAATVAVIHAMNRAYDITESRPWWKVRLTAILPTLGLALFILVSFTRPGRRPRARHPGSEPGFEPRVRTRGSIPGVEGRRRDLGPDARVRTSARPSNG
jgi:hypothetical protein